MAHLIPSWSLLSRACRTAATAAVAFGFVLAPACAGAVDEDAGPAHMYVAGAEVRIDRPVEGDLVAAAGRIHVDQPVAGDAVLGAGSLDLQAPIGEDLRAAGGIVTVASRVQGDMLIAAGRIILTRAADVHGEAWLAAASVALGGRAISRVKVHAREITVTGEFYGPLELSADRIEIGEGARVYGDITYRSASEIKVHPLAHVEGKVTRAAAAIPVHESAAGVPGLKPLRPLVLAALFAFAVLVVALMPNLTGSAVRSLGAAPAKSLGLGTALLFGIPPVAVLLVITIIGIPIGVVLIAAYALGLIAGYVVTALFIAHRLARTVQRAPLGGWRRHAFLAGALLLLALATSVPYVGPVIAVLAAAGGLGALVLQRFSRHAASPPGAHRDAWPAA
jgi:hypothetical protein